MIIFSNTQSIFKFSQLFQPCNLLLTHLTLTKLCQVGFIVIARVTDKGAEVQRGRASCTRSQRQSSSLALGSVLLTISVYSLVHIHQEWMLSHEWAGNL